MSDQYDQNNRGVFFQPHPDQNLIGQGRLNADGADNRIVIVREKLSRDGDPVRSVYMRVGVLFDNDKKGNDKAPDLSGPLDIPAGWGMSGWKGKTESGQHYVSLQVQPPFSKEGGGDFSSGNNSNSGSKPTPDYDEIPF